MELTMSSGSSVSKTSTYLYFLNCLLVNKGKNLRVVGINSKCMISAAVSLNCGQSNFINVN